MNSRNGRLSLIMSHSINKAAVQQAQSGLADNVKGRIQLENYVDSENFDLFGFELNEVLDDIILVKYLDCSDDGTEILKNGIFVPVNTSTFTWRIGEVVLAGPNCKQVKVGSIVCFPNDMGIKVGNLEVTQYGKIKNSCFLNEERIFGICNKLEG